MAQELRTLEKAQMQPIFDVINAAAKSYEGVIPEESDTTPYMPMHELEDAMENMRFVGLYDERLLGVIGVQERADVSLIRHLYVRPDVQRQGIGTRLLSEGLERTESDTVLVGTWGAAEWAIRFYEQNGFENLGSDGALLERYWDIPTHQIEASVVLRHQDSS